MLYLQAQKTFATKELVLIVLLMVFWMIYHSPIIGYIIIFGLFLDKAVNKLIHKNESFSWPQWFLWGALVFSTGFIKLNEPYFIGQHFILDMTNFG